MSALSYLVTKGYKLKDLYDMTILEAKFLMASYEVQAELEHKAMKDAKASAKGKKH